MDIENYDELKKMIFTFYSKTILRKEKVETSPDALKAVLTALLYIKHEGFFEENESRLAVYLANNQKEKNYSIKYRSKHGKLVPYIELFEGERASFLKAVNGVIVGPHPEQDIRIKSLEGFVRSIGLDIAITGSEIPFIYYS